MSTITDRPKKMHIGRNIKRFREILSIKQEALAIELGEDWNQKKVSIMESKPSIDLQLLDKVAAALKIPAEAIKNFDEEKTILNIQNNFEGSNPGGASVVGGSGNAVGHNECTFNPLDKLVQTMDELKSLYAAKEALYAEKEALYERLLQNEKEKMEMLKSKK